ncbi:hypothetical protein Q8A67_001246 [Cirrhinus molitorella]|uniref:AIG1-type G domain-containing protein n=1 Tax=Cirrhinus molitorella TaxID=172907 RepID=A0AA88Q8U9_9TELE|nr:hypothetical protein Q8A67_001246 [Cirrhinus molitorella]
MQLTTGKQGVKPKLNMVISGTDGTLISSISERIVQQSDRDVELNLVKLPALTQLSEEEVVRQALYCASHCDPGVHVFLLIIPDAPLNNEDKAEMEKILSSKINKHIMILIMQNSEHQTAELNGETQTVIESFGGRHCFFGPTTQVSTLMEYIEQMVEENKGGFYSTETLFGVQMKKLEEMKKINSLNALQQFLSQGNDQNSFRS